MYNEKKEKRVYKTTKENVKDKGHSIRVIQIERILIE